MNPLDQQFQKIKLKMIEIRKDPILNALVEKDLLKELLEEMDVLIYETVPDYVNDSFYVRQQYEKALAENQKMENELEDLRYENNKLNEILGY